MKYIGSFFRMNSLTPKEIESQLLYFSRESLKHIVLESRCGIPINTKNLRSAMSNDELSRFKNNTPLLCIYKKAKPNIYSSKHSRSWDESTFKRDIPIKSNALMTLSLLQCTKYYDNFREIDDTLYNTSTLYKTISNQQLEFYYTHLRNTEGFFVDKKNSENSNNGDFNLYEKDKKYDLPDQAFMMIAYYLYSDICKDDEDSEHYKNFSFEILDMFIHFKDELYNLSLDECSNICFSLNIMYEYSQREECKQLLIDLCEFILSNYNEANISLSNIETLGLLSLNLIMCYNNTKIALFKEGFNETIEMFNKLYDHDKNIIQKYSDKKEVKYTSSEIVLYLLNMLIHAHQENKDTSNNNLIAQVYKNYCINSGLITSFPEAPNLDSPERYINLSLRSDDLLDETMFRMPNSTNPELTGLASTFIKNITYSYKKEKFSSDKNSFDSSKNMFLFFSILHLLLPKYTEGLISYEANTTFDDISIDEEI